MVLFKAVEDYSGGFSAIKTWHFSSMRAKEAINSDIYINNYASGVASTRHQSLVSQLFQSDKINLPISMTIALSKRRP